MMVTTTDQGGGRPRLVFAMGGSAPEGPCSVSSASEDSDEYVLVDLGAPGAAGSTGDR